MSRIWHGLQSTAAGLAFPLGGLLGRRNLVDPSRLANGLAIVLPGIEGWGPLNGSIARGLDDGGFRGEILIHDWTTGFWPFFAYHLRSPKRNKRRAVRLARFIGDYQSRYPGRPVHLIGHSGGAAIAIWTIEALLPGRGITSAVLLGPALSPSYNLATALSRVSNGIWNFWSPLDLIFLAAGTLLLGTADGRHTVSAGFRGFTSPRKGLRQVCYTPRMLASYNWGGHFGWANRVFVTDVIAKLLDQDVIGAAA